MRITRFLLIASFLTLILTHSVFAESASMTSTHTLHNLSLKRVINETNTPANQSSSCGVFQPLCDFIQEIVKEASSSINSLINSLLKGFRSGVEGVVKGVAGGVGDAYASLALRIPVFQEPNVSEVPYTTTFPAMDDVFGKALIIAYFLLASAVLFSGIALALESGGVIREGEAMATLKRGVLVAALIMLSKYFYNYFVAGIAYATYAIAPAELVGAYVGKAAVLLVGGWLAIAVFSLGQAIQAFLLFSFLFLFAAAGRILISSALAALLPVILSLTVFPLQTVRKVGMRLLSALVGFMLVPILAAAVLAVGSEAFTMLTAGGAVKPFSAGWWADFAVSTVMYFTALGAPLISMLVIGEAGVGMAFTSYAMMYAAYPMIRAVSQAPGKAVKAVLAFSGAPAAFAEAGSGGPSSRLKEVSSSFINFMPYRRPSPPRRAGLDSI